ncbi:MAG: hypothetical protein Barrevirus19_3 [Barrevirus sp.]|uniref:Uncharacterized protein n=1 Tax=Barrevirus sp. TaxID=2487763 RepID=A0A3G4ZQM9_9VIRU|nr:MAG: hypothetical protein Barrevirus19_3 [Barrevirus sp.]
MSDKNDHELCIDEFIIGDIIFIKGSITINELNILGNLLSKYKQGLVEIVKGNSQCCHCLKWKPTLTDNKLCYDRCGICCQLYCNCVTLSKYYEILIRKKDTCYLYVVAKGGFRYGPKIHLSLNNYIEDAKILLDNIDKLGNWIKQNLENIVTDDYIIYSDSGETLVHIDSNHKLHELAEIKKSMKNGNYRDIHEITKKHMNYGTYHEINIKDAEAALQLDKNKQRFEQWIEERIQLEMVNIIKNGRLFDPANEHYDFVGWVHCDNCTAKIETSIGLDKSDICLICAKNLVRNPLLFEPETTLKSVLLESYSKKIKKCLIDEV